MTQEKLDKVRRKSAPPNPVGKKSGDTREERLKSALKANLARRKAQMRAKAAQSTVSDLSENSDPSRNNTEPNSP